MIRRVAIALVVAIGALVFAHAGSASTYTVCGVSQQVQQPGGHTTLIPLAPGASTGCMTMTAAIAAAQATPGLDTIRMLPGTYCPIDLEGTFAEPVRFIGVGWAAVDTTARPVTLGIAEASLTTVEDETPMCSNKADLVDMNATVTSTLPMVFQNIALNGVNGQSANAGFSQNNVATNTVLRDDIFENVLVSDAAAGLSFIGPSGSLAVENSTAEGNGFGVWFQDFASGSISDSTMSGNSTGLEISDSTVSVGSDTISHNHEGINTVGPAVAVVDTIVAGNSTEDCLLTGGWEVGSPSGGNLLGSGNCPHSAPGDLVDVRLFNEMPPIESNGGPTPSLGPPADAQGMDPAGSCGLGGVDQRESAFDQSLPCDTGAVQSHPSAASAEASDVDLGPVPFQSSTSGTVTLSPGNDLLGVSGVSISGAGWSLSDDRCKFSILESSSAAPFRSCTVKVTLQTTSVRTTWPGTLTLHTTQGDVVANLDAETPGPPSISVFTPVSGASATAVTITGSHFTDASAVSFGMTPAASFTVVSDTQIDAVAGAGTTSGFIRITTPAGTGISSRAFVVAVAPPIVRAFAPDQGHIGATVTITGAYFTGATGVSFGGTPAAVFTVVSDSSITAAVPAGATSGRITVTGPGGTSPSVAVFTVLPAVAPTPTITSVSPGSGIHGVRVTIRGAGLTGATQVTFNGKAAVFTVVNDSTITAIVPAGATSGPIRVTTPGGTATSAANFSFL